MPNFVGFSAVKDGGYVPVLPGLSLCNLNEMHNVNSNFQIVLKKMNKKDSTTRYKVKVIIVQSSCINHFVPI